MSKLSDKEIEYFRELLPDGVAIVDFRDIQNEIDFVRKYCPINQQSRGHSLEIAIMGFINQVKKK